MSVGFHKINNGRGATVSGAATALALAEQVRRDPRAVAALERARAGTSAATSATAAAPAAVSVPAAVSAAAASAAVAALRAALAPAVAELRQALAELEALGADVAPPPERDAAALRVHCLRLGMTVAEARSKCRRRELVQRRRTLIAALHGEGWTQTRIAAALHCNHSTVGHALRRTNYQSTIINES